MKEVLPSCAAKCRGKAEVYAVVDGHLFLIGPAELRHLRWMMHMSDSEAGKSFMAIFICDLAGRSSLARSRTRVCMSPM